MPKEHREENEIVKIVQQAMPGVQNACVKDLDGIVAVHMEAFPDYFLTHLGPGLLRRYYESFFGLPDAFVVKADDVNRICGFIAARFWHADVLHSFYRRHALYLAGRVIWRLVQMNPVVAKGLLTRTSHMKLAIQSLMGRRPRPNLCLDAPPPRNQFRLTCIAVLPEYQGRGVAAALLQYFEQKLQERKIEIVGLSVNRENERAIRFYEKSGWKISAETPSSLSFVKHL